MEATRLIDPGFWSSESAAFPGVGRPDWAEQGQGLVWFMTSGSTGEPCWIGHSRDGLLLSAAVVNRHLQVDASDIWGLALPLRHVGGFGVVARAFEAGSRLAVFDGKWDARRLAQWLEARRINHLSLVPTQVHDLVKAGLRAPESLKTLVVGGGVLEETMGRAARGLGWPVLPSYGLTEAASQVATANPEQLDRPYRTGPLAVLPHWQVTIGDDGRIGLQGPALYRARAFTGSGSAVILQHADPLHVTSDRGRLDGGLLRILGRADFLVKILGELVDPVAVEQQLGLEHAAVTAVMDARRQHQLVVAWEREPSETERRSVEEHNRTAEGPERVVGSVRVEVLPRGTLGKLRRGELAQQVGEIVARQGMQPLGGPEGSAQ